MFGRRVESTWEVGAPVRYWGRDGALSDSGISSPKDFEGRTVGFKVFPAPEYLGMLKAAGVNRARINEVGVGFDPRVLTERKVDVLPVFRSNEPDQIRGLGFEVRTFDPADYGVVLAELQQKREVHESTRRRLQARAYAHTAAYDAAIAGWLAEQQEREHPERD